MKANGAADIRLERFAPRPERIDPQRRVADGDNTPDAVQRHALHRRPVQCHTHPQTYCPVFPVRQRAVDLPRDLGLRQRRPEGLQVELSHLELEFVDTSAICQQDQRTMPPDGTAGPFEVGIQYQ